MYIHIDTPGSHTRKLAATKFVVFFETN
jgi:hypothetical protein